MIVRSKRIAWGLLAVGALVAVVANVVLVGSADESRIPVWFPAAAGVAGLSIGWGIALLLSGTARRVMTWIMVFNSAWALVVGSLLTVSLMRLR